jgi:exodeoxyribonuclease VII large subunit
MKRALSVKTHRANDQLLRLNSMMNALSYKGVLSRGYALIRDDKGKPLMSAAAISISQKLKIEFSDGVIEALSGAVAKKRVEEVKQETLF